MNFIPYKDEHARELVEWFDDENAALLWGGRVLGWPLSVSRINEYVSSIDAECFCLQDHSGQLQGFIELRRPQLNEMRFCRVAINPHVRGRGLGKQLLRYAITYTKQLKDIQYISLAVFIHNEPAKRCYQALGFEVVEKDPTFRSFHDEKWPLHQMELVL